MAWKIVWSADAAKFMDGLEKVPALQIMSKLEKATEDPLRYFSRLVGYEDYKLRAGDYRIIALLLHSEKAVFIEKVGHRKNVYR